MNDNKVMNRAADNIRILAAAMVEKAKSGHPGGAMGGADFINTLYSEFLVYDPENPAWEGRDRFFLDPGHMAPMLYSQLTLIGKYTLDDLKNLRQWGSVTPGHPEREIERGIENTSGPLGQGHTFAVGAAIAAKFLKARLGNVMNQTIYAYVSDGGVQEEISQGAGRIAGNLGLDNLIMFYDANDIQLSTKTEVVTCEDTAKKYESWGWYVQKIDGNDVDQIREAIKKAQAEKERPSLIIGHCVMGKGARKADNTSYESNCATHGAPLGGDAFVNTMKNLGADPENPFQIFPEVEELYAKRRASTGFAFSADTYLQEELESSLLEYLLSFNAYKRSTDFQVPVLFVSGSDDWSCPVGPIEEYCGVITAPKKEMYLVDGCGHSPQMQLPEECCQVIKSFLGQ